MDPDRLIFRSCYGFGDMVRMEIGVIVLFIAAFYIFILLIGGFNDLVKHKSRVMESRRKWQDQELRKGEKYE